MCGLGQTPALTESDLSVWRRQEMHMPRFVIERENPVPTLSTD